MYLYEKMDNKQAIKDNFIIGMFVPRAKLDEADRVEVWCSNFTDAGGDFNEFRLFKKDAPTPFYVHRQNGFQKNRSDNEKVFRSSK